MEDHQLKHLGPDEIAHIEEKKLIVSYDEQPVRSDHEFLQVVRFTVRAPKSSIDHIRADLSARIFVDESDPPEQGVNLPMRG